jgi:hypothetical protein
MSDFRRQPIVCFELVRKGKLLAAAVVLGVVLTGCGGGDDSSAAAPTSPRATPPSAGAAPGGAPTSPGGALAGSGGSDLGGALPGGAPGGVAGSGSVTLSWVPPTMNDDGSALKLTGYRIYWGPSDDNFTHSVVLDNPGLTRYVVEQLASGTWYFVATALSGDRESEYSNVFSTTVK